MPFFTRVFRSNKDSSASKKFAKSSAAQDAGPPKPSWTDAWLRTEISPDEVQALLRGCTQELKARALDTPFLLLPFRPSSDPSASRTFIRNYFNNSFKNGSPIQGDELMQELRLTDPMVLCSVVKWCWSRLPGGIVTWEAYELFKVGEQDSGMARDAFSTFIPISADSDARAKVIFDFFELLAAVAAHGKRNGLGGRKLSRYAGWWAFEHTDMGTGFEAAYKNWAAAADATSHLFFAYLRSISPDLPRGLSGISTLPIALQSLVQATEYPPETPSLLQVSTTKVVMIVDTVSPTPFALLRRAKNFEYRDSDYHLQEFSNFEDPIQALTDECLRVLRCISATNQSSISSSKTSTSLRDASWSRFEDIGFGGAIESEYEDNMDTARGESTRGLRSAPHSGANLGRPTTPSWADFLSSGFNEDENTLRGATTSSLLPPDKMLPPIPTDRGQSSQSHKRSLDTEAALEPGELASITTLDLDDSFWWVWISSLAGEEPGSRKAVFGRCTLIETNIRGAKWLILEEQVKGAAPDPEPGAYIVEKRRFFGFSRRGKLSRRKSSAKKMDPPYKQKDSQAPQSKTSIAPDQHARIQAAAAALQKKHKEQEQGIANGSAADSALDTRSTKTNSVMTLQPAIMTEASQAMKWAKNYDKDAYRSAYLSDARAGTGAPTEGLKVPTNDNAPSLTHSTTSPQLPPPAETDAAAIEHAPAAPQQNTEPAVEEAATAREETNPVTETPPAEQHPKKLKKKPGNTGIKGIFGSKAKGEQPPMKPTGAEPSAVAAARAALEGKAKASQAQPKAANGSSVKKPVRAPVTDVRTSSEKPEVPPKTSEDAGPPRTQHAAEADALSVDTYERDAADREFSRFDQGPLVEQPAFVPDSPVSSEPETIPERTKQSMENTSNGRSSSPPAVTNGRNRFAERTGRSHAPGDQSISTERTGDSETSGEENIESRVARIRARVAKLTENMESAR